MRPIEIRIWRGAFLAVVGIWAARGWADDQIDLPIYIPAPADRLHANRATIGPPYAPENIPDSSGSVADGNLLVSGNVGVGTAVPRSDPPNAVAAGNLDVWDVYLRSIGRWVSQFNLGRRALFGSNENASAVSFLAYPTNTEVTVASVTMATSGRAVVIFWKLKWEWDSSFILGTSAFLYLYRDGSQVEAFSIDRTQDTRVLMTAQALAAGSHTFQLRVKINSAYDLARVPAGGAKLIVMEM